MTHSRKHRITSSIKVPITAITTILMAASAYDLAAQAPAEQKPAAELMTDPANDYFSRINQLYTSAAASKDYGLKDRLYNQLIPMLRNYLNDFPRHKNAEASWYYLAESYYFTGKVREAVLTYKKVTDKYKSGPYVAASSYRLARDYFAKSDFMEAAEYYGKTAKLSKDPKDQVRVKYFQAQAYMQANRSDLATAVYKEVARTPGDNPYREGAALAYGRLGLKKGDYADALLELEKLITPNQSMDVKAEATYYAGTAALQLKKIDLAEKYYNMSMETKTSLWKGQSQTGLMLIYYDRNDYQGVLELKQKGVYEMAKLFKAKQAYLLGMSCYKLQKHTSAIDHFIDVEIFDSGSDNAFYAGYYKLQCFYILKNGTLDDKVDRYIENYAVNHGKHKFIHLAFVMKAETLFANGEYADAGIIYDKINEKILAGQNLTSLLYKKAICFYETKNYVGASDTATAFIEAHPEHSNVMEMLLYRASAYAKQGNNKKAIRDYDHVIANSKDSRQQVTALKYSGRIQFLDSRFDDTILRLKKLVEEHKNQDPKVLGNANYYIGRSLFEQKNYNESMPYLSDSIKHDPLTFLKQVAMMSVIGNFSMKKIEETEAAIQLAEKARIRTKIPLPVYRWLGSHYYNEAAFLKAAQYLAKGIEKSEPAETPINVWRFLTKAQMKAKLYQEAFLSVDTLLTLEEDKSFKVTAMLDKAKIQMGLGKDGDAKRTAEKALEMNPVGRMKAELLLVIGDFHFNIGQPEEAAKHYVLLVDSAKELPEHPRILHRLAETLKKSEKTEDAAHYEALLEEKYPNFKAQ